MMPSQDRALLIVCFALAFLAGLLGLFTDIMDVDASQYALMSRDMLASKDFLHFYCREIPYLDKPPLVFWTASLSYALLGVSNFSYKLPSFLILLLGAYSIYRFCKLYYDELTAVIALVIMVFSQWFFMISMDVKTDNLLIGFCSLSLWQFGLHIKTRKLSPLLLGFTFLGFALLAKGPIAAVTIGAAVAGHLFLSKDWKTLFNVQWFLGLPILGVLLLPMCIGLYEQYGKTGVLFYFWTQSFGRITGDSSWHNELGPDFFLHTTLWAFLPWCIPAIPAILHRLSLIFKRVEAPEWMTLTGFILPFIALSTSKFKLPHYIFITYPFLSVITASWLAKTIENRKIASKIMSAWGILFWILSLTLLALIAFWVFPERNSLAITGFSFLLFTGAILVFYKNEGGLRNILILSSLSLACLQIVANLHFYPSLFQFQTGSSAGRYIHTHIPKSAPVYGYKHFSYSLDFYANKRVTQIEDLSIVNKSSQPVYLFVDKKDLIDIKNKGFHTETLASFPSYHISLLSWEFLNPETRSTVIDTFCIEKIVHPKHSMSL